MITDGEYWLRRAEEVRIKAEAMKHDLSRAQMLHIVEQFERQALACAKHSMSHDQYHDLVFELGMHNEPK